MTQNNKVMYRADIDGLRAIAVIAVVGYHAFPQWFSGGFVGVDIFFVISGYLITSIILRSSAKGDFSVLDFYSRRIRRIMPALITMFAMCLLLGWLLLFPDELQQLGKHTLGATFFVSNFVFWSEADYFDNASELKPLLHLWSLSIEEQFYTLWPITLLFFVKIKRPLLSTCLLLLASFLLCVFGTQDKTANFYMPLTRIWELLCGGALAFVLIDSRFTARLQGVLAELLSVTGITLLGLSIFVLLNSKSELPGWASLLPIIGAVLVIAAGPTTLLNRYLLGNPIAVFIGLISYPLYLWHWPFLAFPKITDGLVLPLNMRLCAVAGAFIFAVITYYCIEKPLRHRGNIVSVMLLVVALSVGACGYLFMSGIVQPRNASELTQKISDATTDYPLNDKYLTAHPLVIDGFQYWEVGSGKKTTLFIGDSNMDMYWPSVEAVIPVNDSTRRALMATTSGCPAILNLGSADQNHPDVKPCATMKSSAFGLAFRSPDIKTVVLGSMWLGLASWDFVSPTGVYPVHTPEGMKLAMDQLVTTVVQLRQQGKTVYVLLNIPLGPEFDPHNLIKRSLRSFALAPYLSGGITVAEYRNRTQRISPQIAEAVQRSGAILLDPVDLLCHDGWCSAVTPEGEPIYRNDDHLRASFTRTHPSFIGQTLQ